MSVRSIVNKGPKSINLTVTLAKYAFDNKALHKPTILSIFNKSEMLGANELKYSNIICRQEVESEDLFFPR